MHIIAFKLSGIIHDPENIETMKRVYIINDALYFDESAQTLSLNGEEENTLQLPCPAVRLLSELIKNNGTLLCREEILQNVWEAYGFRASNSNLNNYLSILRKQIAALDPQASIITTLPKQGVVFNAEVKLLSETADAPSPCVPAMVAQEPLKETSLPVSLHDATVCATGPLLRNGRAQYLTFGLLLGVLLLMMFWGYSFFQHQRFPEITLLSLPPKGKCHFYVLPGSKLSAGQEREVLTKLDVPLDCNSQPVDVFVGYGNDANHSRHMAFVSWCLREVDRRYSRCENVKQQLWGER